MINTKIIYKCDLCRKEFDELSYGGETSMGTLSYTMDCYGRLRSRTLGKYGDPIHLCSECNRKFEDKLKELGFTEMFEGSSSAPL